MSTNPGAYPVKPNTRKRLRNATGLLLAAAALSACAAKGPGTPDSGRTAATATTQTSVPEVARTPVATSEAPTSARQSTPVEAKVSSEQMNQAAEQFTGSMAEIGAAMYEAALKDPQKGTAYEETVDSGNPQRIVTRSAESYSDQTYSILVQRDAGNPEDIVYIDLAVEQTGMDGAPETVYGISISDEGGVHTVDVRTPGGNAYGVFDESMPAYPGYVPIDTPEKEQKIFDQAQRFIDMAQAGEIARAEPLPIS